MHHQTRHVQIIAALVILLFSLDGLSQSFVRVPFTHQPMQTLANSWKVNINTASFEELQLLPSVGPSLAHRILDDRSAHGAFLKPDDLLRVNGIGPRTLDKVRPYTTTGTTDIDTP
jgi:competence ComEA-like helix-hairpin-helix protein